MESNSENPADPAAARDVLGVIGSDRARIGQRMTAETWWAAPAQGIGAALLVAAPAAGWRWAWLLLVASMWVFLSVEWLFRTRSGLNITRPAGPGGLALLIVLVILLIGAFGVSLTLAILNLSGWIGAVAMGAGVAFALGVVSYDRMYAVEVRRAH